MYVYIYMYIYIYICVCIQERERRFVRRCAPAKTYALWRQRPPQPSVTRSLTAAARRGIENVIALTPLLVSLLLLLHCSMQEDYTYTEHELLRIPLLNAAESGDVLQVKLLLDHGAALNPKP